jgi:uncharacterized protein YggE
VSRIASFPQFGGGSLRRASFRVNRPPCLCHAAATGTPPHRITERRNRMRRILALLGLLGLLALPTALAAQPTPLPETELHIGESAEVTRAPDEVVATLRAEARAGTAAAAQEAVNRSVAAGAGGGAPPRPPAAVARARAVQGVRVSTGGYWTGRVDEGRTWQAAQQVTLRGGDGAALLELAGALQGQGLAVNGLHWQLTRETERAAREEASRLALDGLRRRAAAVAEQLGLVLVGLKEVRIDVPDRMPRPMPMAMAMAARSASADAPPPVAVAEDVVVQATVQAVAVLRPR